MPYPQDLVGKYIDYALNLGGPLLATMTLVNGVLPGQTTAGMATVYSVGKRLSGDAPDIVRLSTGPPAWNFTFLKYEYSF